MRFLVLPGYGDSGPRHWQTLWEKRDPEFKRVKQRDWDHPDRAEWVGALGRTIADHPGDLVLVAHSLACLLVAHWTQASQPRMRGRVRAAFLVAPPDTERADTPPQLFNWRPIIRERLPFASLAVLSSDDPFCSLDRGLGMAADWGSDVREIGARGHINGESGLGDWRQGMAWLGELAERAGR